MTDTTARDRLAGALLGVLAVASNFPERARARLLGQDMRPLAEKCATEILNAGWRPPARVVTTVEELDALPDMSVIRDAQDRVMRLCDGEFYEVGYEVDVWPTLSATVLWEPKEGE